MLGSFSLQRVHAINTTHDAFDRYLEKHINDTSKYCRRMTGWKASVNKQYAKTPHQVHAGQLYTYKCYKIDKSYKNYTEASACESSLINILQEFILKTYLKGISGKEFVRQ